MSKLNSVIVVDGYCIWDGFLSVDFPLVFTLNCLARREKPVTVIRGWKGNAAQARLSLLRLPNGQASAQVKSEEKSQMSERIYVFLYLQCAAIGIVGFPFVMYKAGLYSRREKRPTRIFLFIVIPPMFLIIQVLAFSLLFSSEL